MKLATIKTNLLHPQVWLSLAQVWRTWICSSACSSSSLSELRQTQSQNRTPEAVILDIKTWLKQFKPSVRLKPRCEFCTSRFFYRLLRWLSKNMSIEIRLKYPNPPALKKKMIQLNHFFIIIIIYYYLHFLIFLKQSSSIFT